MDTVSILIPTFNRAKFLRDAICSALAQTYNDIEVFVLDDASLDNTPEVVAEFEGNPRIKYIRHQANLGIASNWKAGIEASTGEFFCLLHDDDTFEPSFVEKLIVPMQNDSSLILAFCDHWVMDVDGKRLPVASDEASRRFRRNEIPKGRLADWATSALIHSSLPVGATLFRKGLVNSAFIDERAKGAIDAWLFYQCAKIGCGSYYVSERLMNYRLHGGGMSRSALLHMGEGHIFRFQQILADPQMAEMHTQVRRHLAGALSSYGIQLLVDGRRQDARRSLKQALQLRGDKRAIFAYGLAHGGEFGTRLARAIRSK